MLSARVGAALALTTAFALSACGPNEKAPPPAQAGVPDGVLSADWSYTPASEETRQATGVLTVEAGIDQTGPLRALAGASGIHALTHLEGEASPQDKVGDRTIAEVMDLPPGARPMLHEVSRDGGLCAGQPANFVVWYEPEMIEGRQLVLAVVQGAKPGEAGSTVCRVLRYTRERGPGTGRDEAAR